MLSTAFTLLALFCAVFAGIAAFISGRNALALDEAERNAASAARALKSSTDRLMALEGRLDRLAGRVYATSRKPQPNGDYTRADWEAAGVKLTEPADLDPDLAAELALQNAAPIAPGKR